MRIPFPKSIPFPALIAFLAVILLIQLIQGTDPIFAVLMLVAQLAAVGAFNLMGGMTHMAGAFCLFSILPTVTVPELTHMALGQAGEYKLEHPLATAGVCAVFYVSVLSAALLASLIRPVEPYLDRIPFSILELRIISALAAVFAAVVNIFWIEHPGRVDDGSLLAAAGHFLPLMLAVSIMLATYVQLKVTNGKSSMNWYIAVLLSAAMIPGILSASKGGMITPGLCWLVVVAASGHRLSRVGTIVLLGCVILLWEYVFPFSQNARGPVRDAETVSERVDLIIDYFLNPSNFVDVRSSFDESYEFGAASAKVNILVRYSVLKSIDMLIGADDKVGYTPIERYTPVFIALVPHMIWPDRPSMITSNELGHKAGFPLSDNDTTTGIEIASPALFYDLGGWIALMVYSILSFSAFFFVTRRIFGTVEKGIWALVPMGTEVLLAAGASPASMFLLVSLFLMTFAIAIASLKIISYVFQGLVSEPASSRV